MEYQKAQLVIADIPYNLGSNAMQVIYVVCSGDNKNGEKVRKLVKRSSVLITISTLRNNFHFAIGY